MNRWMYKFGLSIIVACSTAACGDVSDAPPPEDPEESFLTDGRADGLGPSEGAPDTCAILRLVNEAPLFVLDDSSHVGLDVRAARNIADYRKDDSIDSLEELDSISWVGFRAYSKLRYYVTHDDFVAEQTDQSGTAYGESCGEEPEEPQPLDCPRGTTEAGDSCVPLDCSWESAFAARYGQDFRSTDIGFVTYPNRVTMGIDSLDIDASQNRVRLRVHGIDLDVTEVRLYDSDSNEVLARRSGPYIYGLGHAAWSQSRGYGRNVRTSILHQFTMEEPTRPQLTAYLELLLRKALDKVPSGDREAFDRYRRMIMDEVRSGSLTFRMGHGHAIPFRNSRRHVEGATYAIQFSNSFGLPPEIGFRKEGSWGDKWVTVPTHPTCDGLTVATRGDVTYARSQESLPFAKAESACEAMGGVLATIDSGGQDAFARSLAAGGGTWIGLSDRENEGDFGWSDGTALDYTNWHSGEPNDWRDGEDCVELRDYSTTTEWNDLHCGTNLGFVCEIDG